MAIYAAKLMTTLIMGGSLLSLGGCAQMHNWGQSMWTGTKNLSATSSQKITSILRPAPKQTERFETARRPAPMPDTLVADFMRRYAVPITEDTPTFVAMNRTRENGVHIYRPGSQARANYTQITPQAITPAPIYQAPQSRAITPSLRPSSAPDFMPKNPKQLAGGLPSASTAAIASYVKTSGGASMADWQACQTDAGDIYLASGNSYSINPNFDHCMRAKGYLPESEAVQDMELAGG